jgi:hypothetical protein
VSRLVFSFIVAAFLAHASAPMGPKTSDERPPLPRAMWVWDADPPLLDATARMELLSFSRRQNIGTLWIQVARRDEGSGSRDLALRHEAEWRLLLADAHREGITIEALDGAPYYALKEYHEIPLGLVDAVIAFNDASKPAERFDGIHFNNEPYLLPGWSDPDERREILKEFLELNAEVTRRAHARSSMVFGVDLPFWWPYINDRTGRPHAEVEFRGTTKAASFHCVDLLDNVGIMDYRNSAQGSDGMIAHARALLSYAESASRAKIYVGIETSFTEPRTFWFAAGLPSGDFRRVAGRGGRRLPNEVSGFETKSFSDDRAVHVGLRVPRETSAEVEQALQRALLDVVKDYGAAGRNERTSGTDVVTARAIEALRRDPEWVDEEARPIPGPDGRPASPGFRATAIMLPKLTFAMKSIEEMRRELDTAEAAWRRYSRYAGIAIHHYATYRAKIESGLPKPAPPPRQLQFSPTR